MSNQNIVFNYFEENNLKNIWTREILPENQNEGYNQKRLYLFTNEDKLRGIVKIG